MFSCNEFTFKILNFAAVAQHLPFFTIGLNNYLYIKQPSSLSLLGLLKFNNNALAWGSHKKGQFAEIFAHIGRRAKFLEKTGLFCFNI